jgi:hypothetical protein
LSDAKQRVLSLAEWVAQITEWDPSKHPRRGTDPNPGWFAQKGSGSTTVGSAGSTHGATTPTNSSRTDSATTTAKKRSSFADKVIQRNLKFGELTGVVTPGMVRSSRLAAELQAAGRLPGEVGGAATAGLGTGSKAVVNGTATAIKNAATLGLSTSQLELIGVTKEDRDRGYDTAVAISTASGQVLVAVGTSGLTSVLSKGGTVARVGSGALIAFDASGNAVGVVQGVYDASENGLTISNGVQIAGGALGLSANVAAARTLKQSFRSPITPRIPHRAKFGTSTSKNYRKTFFTAHPEKRGKVVIHHAVEQGVLKRYPGLVTESEMHSLENLRGISTDANADLHLKAIRQEWTAFYKQHPVATKQQLLDKAMEIDEKFGHLFDPPI